MAPESHSLGKTSTSSAWPDLGSSRVGATFSIDKNITLSSTGSQTLRTQWFGNTFVILLDDSNIFSADRRSDSTNTVLSDAASSKRIESHLARENKYV